MDQFHSGYIRTPSELDAAARALERSLGQTSSPQKRLQLISDFYSHAHSLPDAWLTGYILFLAPMVIELVRLPYIQNFPPDVWSNVYELLLRIQRQPWAERHTGIDEALRAVLEQSILAHGFVSSLRELHNWLKQRALVTETLNAADWASIFGASTTGFGLFEAYVGILEARGSSFTGVLHDTLRRWREFRSQTNCVSVILLEEENLEAPATGRVLLMDILPQHDQKGTSHLNNFLGDSGHQTMDQLQRAETLSDTLIRDRFSSAPPPMRFIFSLHERSAELIGGSLGLSAVAGLLSLRTKQMNLPERWSLPSTVACIGSVDEAGSVEAGTWESVESKLLLAFHSPLEHLVVPAVHREAALHALQRLQRDFPNRILEVIGISHIRDIPQSPGIFLNTARSGVERMRERVMRNSILVTLMMVVLLLAGGAYLVFISFYDYPNLEHTRGASVASNSIVFNPKDSLRWCFRDADAVKAAKIPFGDIEVGDGFTRSFSLWNMTPTTLDLRLCIEGDDSLDWFVNSGEQLLRIPSVTNAGFSVMYRPLSAGMHKQARMVLRDPDSNEELYALDLTGAAGKPRMGGYALHFDGLDDVMYFGKQSTAFDIAASANREITFECWFRPTHDDRNFMLLHNGFYSAAKNEISDLYLGFDSLQKCYYRVGSNVRIRYIPSAVRPMANSWSHIALAISIPQRRVALSVNGVVIDDHVEDFLLQAVGLPNVTIGAYEDEHGTALHYAGDLDEVRLWHEFRTEDQIRSTMHTTLNGLTPGLMGYWDMDNNVEGIVFNANKRANCASLLNRPSSVRSEIRLEKRGSDIAVVASDGPESAIELNSGRYLSCAEQILPRYGSATFSLRFLQTSEPAIHFNYVRTHEGWISIEEAYTYTRVQRRHISIAPGWRHAVFTVTERGVLTLYIDGVAMDTTRVTMKPPYDWHAHYEGMLIGFHFDKEHQLRSTFYGMYFPALSHPRIYRDFNVWNRLLTTEEIQHLSEGGMYPDSGLVGAWPLDSEPDGYNNFIDRIGGARLHVKSVSAWH